MSLERVPNTHCNKCGKQMTIMKRCTRCKMVVYCSRECQVKDWPEHQVPCRSAGAQKTTDTSPHLLQGQTYKSKYQTDDRSIFSDEASTSQETPISHRPLVDWSKAFKDKKSTTELEKKSPVCEEKSYLYKNEFHTDLPVVDETNPFSKIIVKCNKVKHDIKIQNSWNGAEVFKFLSYSLKVPLENLKIIHKGKVLSEETILDTVKDRAIYQVIGEIAESEDGLDQRDIAVMMKQLGVDRNNAVKALKKSDSLIDAMLG